MKRFHRSLCAVLAALMLAGACGCSQEMKIAGQREDPAGEQSAPASPPPAPSQTQAPGEAPDAPPAQTQEPQAPATTAPAATNAPSASPTPAREDCGTEGHVWGETVYTWSNDDGVCTASRVCENCGKTESETVAAEYRADGPELTGTAMFSEPGFVQQQKIKETDGTAAAFVVSDAAGEPGDTVELTVSLRNNPGIIAAALNISYDADALTLVEARDRELLPNALFGDSCERQPFYVSWSDALAEEDHREDGELVTLVFRINEEAPTGAAEVTVSYQPGNVVDQALRKVTFLTVAGTVMIE